jgi:hypothetical protein
LHFIWGIFKQIKSHEKKNKIVKVFLYDNMIIIVSVLNLCSRLWGTLIIGI